ncbi:MAG TPA: hypothetical protein PLC42_03210 [Parachlamydiaceae bacterium]|nr:hypothetical protein [Parachlamydiaceae bacterium]
MPQDQNQPIKLLGSLINSNYGVIDTFASVAANPPGTVVDVPVLPGGAIPANSSDLIAMYQLAGNNIALVNQFFASFNKNSNPLPGDIRDFASKYAKFLVAQGLYPPNDVAVLNSLVKDVLNGFLQSYLSSISYFSGAEGAYMQGLFSTPIASLSAVDADGNHEQYGFIDTVWKGFTGNYPYQLNGSLTTNLNQAIGFFENFRVFTVPSATITSGFVVNVNDGSSSVVATSSATPSFETTFYQYFPSLAPSSPLFGQYLDLFQKDMVAKHGYFSPSRQYTEWVPFVQTLANITAPHVATLPVQDVTILNDILHLVIQMILSIQRVAASQADRLSLYTSWQRGYTDLLNQVHVFTAASDDKLRDFNSGNPFTDNPSLSDVQKKRQDEQGNFNAGMVQQITAYKDTVSEDAKALQSRVNQSSDAFNDQANTATAILQEISTILSAIFR